MEVIVPHAPEPPDLDDLFFTVAELLSDKTDSDEESAETPSTASPRIPRVFKCDIRWDYMNMYVNSVNSGDVFLAYSFLKTFARPNFVQSVRGLHQRVAHPPASGLVNFVKNWYLNLLSAPDLVIRPTSVNVKKYPDGTSEVTSVLIITRTFMYERPVVDLHGLDSDEMLFASPEVGAKRKVTMSQAAPSKSALNLKAMGWDSAKAKQYERTRRIRLTRHTTNLSDRECEFLELLACTEQGRPLPPSQLLTGRATGLQTLTLDANKRITSFSMALSEHKYSPVEL